MRKNNSSEKTKEEETKDVMKANSSNKIKWEKPQLIKLDIRKTAGGSQELFEDESGFAS